MPEAVICEPVRSAVGRYGGVYRDVPVTELASTVIRGLLDRTGVPDEAVDDVILGQCYPNGEAPALGRVAALDAGLPVEVGGYQLDRRCGSGLQAVILAVMQVQTGASDVVIAGGAESMSQAEFYTDIRWGPRARASRSRPAGARPGDRRRQEYPGARRHARDGREPAPRVLHPARGAGRVLAAFAPEGGRRSAGGLLPGRDRAGDGAGKKGAVSVVDTDEHPRADSSMEVAGQAAAGDAEVRSRGHGDRGQLERPERRRVGLHRHHAGARRAARAAPYGRLVTWAVAGVPPRTMGIGPVPSTAKALERAGLKLSDIDVIELNEAFAAQVLAVLREWGIDWRDDERFNPNGSGISLGHPVGATGGRILATMLREMRRRGSRYGLETMCIGGGQGLSAVFERVE